MRIHFTFVQGAHANGAATESKPTGKRNQKPGKKPGGKNVKEGSKKSHNIGKILSLTPPNPLRSKSLI